MVREWLEVVCVYLQWERNVALLWVRVDCQPQCPPLHHSAPMPANASKDFTHSYNSKARKLPSTTLDVGSITQGHGAPDHQMSPTGVLHYLHLAFGAPSAVGWAVPGFFS